MSREEQETPCFFGCAYFGQHHQFDYVWFLVFSDTKDVFKPCSCRTSFDRVVCVCWDITGIRLKFNSIWFIAQLDDIARLNPIIGRYNQRHFDPFILVRCTLYVYLIQCYTWQLSDNRAFKGLKKAYMPSAHWIKLHMSHVSNKYFAILLNICRLHDAPIWFVRRTSNLLAPSCIYKVEFWPNYLWLDYFPRCTYE